ncbi:MAG TPA: TetR/AcrR family transcriptional regulator [Cyclobacteriaceae bacterium]|nr:TetR/AcrR family transcriptional regulator [Cyclobacteriaceae bacterium]
MESFHSFAPAMEEQDLIKDKILRGAEELFLKYGVRSVSMDDIARHLSISKKTIYQYFVDKDEIVTQVTQGHLTMTKTGFDALTGASKNALDELMRIQMYMKKNMQDLNPSLLFDLKKYHPKAWTLWMEHKNKDIRESVVRNLKQGMEEGLYRTNLNPEILATLRIESIQWLYDGVIVPNEKFKMVDIQVQMLDHFMYGLLTEKGRKLYEKYKQEPINLELIPHNI